MKLSNIKPDRIKKFLIKNGFELKNIKGSHFYYSKGSHLVCVVDHNNEELGYQSVNSIIRNSGLKKSGWFKS
ncbi:MAG: type II toxin-antitoxin system HicA family toxin [Patescibacteria group bacterium]